MLWIITDTHFDHHAMIKRCGRPENFDAIICRNWRERVKPQDTVIHLGDCAWRPEGMKRLLELPEPVYHHHRLVLDAEGKKLSKSDGATGIAAYRAAGHSAADIRALLL